MIFWKRVAVKITIKKICLTMERQNRLWLTKYSMLGDFIAKEADGVEGFNFRERFMPTMYSDAKIDVNFEQPVGKMQSFIKMKWQMFLMLCRKPKLYFKLETRLPIKIKLRCFWSRYYY